MNRLRKEKVIESQEVREALLRVDRSLFVPSHEKRRAYHLQAINLIPGTSSISQPQVVATMLEGLQVERGHRILEIGTASGYNAALLAELAGDPHLIYTVEFVESLVYSARENLQKAGYSGVHVICGDGSRGFSPGSPYDRIILTASSFFIPPPLFSQLREGGRLILPYDFYNLITLLLAIQKKKGEGRGEIFGFPVLFVPLQGEGIEREVDLKKYRHHVARKKNRETIGLSLEVISSFQREGRIHRKEIRERWEKKGRPTEEEYSLKLLEDGHLQVRWIDE